MAAAAPVRAPPVMAAPPTAHAPQPAVGVSLQLQPVLMPEAPPFITEKPITAQARFVREMASRARETRRGVVDNTEEMKKLWQTLPDEERKPFWTVRLVFGSFCQMNEQGEATLGQSDV